MFNQLENQVLALQEQCQSLLSEIETLQQVLNELNDEELTQITGGIKPNEIYANYRANVETAKGFGPAPKPISISQHIDSFQKGMLGIRDR